jgi:hypothetical protein
MKRGIIIQPPEGWEDKDHEAGPGLPHALEFANGTGVIGGRSRVLAVLLEERQDGATGKEPSANLVVVYQDGEMSELISLTICKTRSFHVNLVRAAANSARTAANSLPTAVNRPFNSWTTGARLLGDARTTN